MSDWQNNWNQQQPGYPAQSQGHQSGYPTAYLPSDADIVAAYQKSQEQQARAARAREGGGGDRHWFRPLGPQGQEKWDASVPVGYEARYVVWLCPHWSRPAMPHVDDENHFYRSAEKPGGTSVGCLGDRCWVCAARSLAFKSGNPDDAKRANTYGRRQRRALYQILLLDYYHSHFLEDGRMVPFLFRAPGGLHDDIVSILRERPAAAVLDPVQGRPLIIKRKKKGKERMDISWNVQAGDPSPLPEYFYPALQNLYDLDAIVKKPTAAEQYQAILAMGFPVPPGLADACAAEAQGQGQPSYSPTPNPPTNHVATAYQSHAAPSGYDALADKIRGR